MIILPLTALFVSSASAFNVKFWSGIGCTGNTVGNFDGSVDTFKTCQNAFNNGSGLQTAPGGGFNVQITQTKPNDKTSAIAFFSRNDCAAPLIAYGNVDSCMGAGKYQSFKILTFDAAAGFLQPYLLPAEYQSISLEANATLQAGQNLDDTPAAATAANTVASSSSSPSPSPTHVNQRRDPNSRLQRRRPAPPSLHQKRRFEEEASRLGERSAIPGRLSHGDTLSANGALYKWHQVSTRSFRGIPVKEWDDKLHKRNAEPVFEDQVAEEPGPFEQRRRKMRKEKKKRSDGSVAEGAPNTSPNNRHVPRSITSACMMTRTCLINNPESALLTIDEVGDDLLSAIAAHEISSGSGQSGNDWTYLYYPFALELLNTAGQVQGYVMAETKVNSDPSLLATCSTGGTERSCFQDTLVEGNDGAAITDLRVDLTIGDIYNSLFVSTRAASNKNLDFRPICEVIEINTVGS